MSLPDRPLSIDQAIDVTSYPLHEVGGRAWRETVSRVRAELAAEGCSVLRDFVLPERLEPLRAECTAVAGLAYDEVRTVNVYNTAPDPALPADHPAQWSMERGNSFVARVDIPEDFLIHRLYLDERFQRFLADCLEVPRVHPLADPFAGLCLNVVEPGREHPWHFDTNEYAVSMVTQAPESGGVFEYCPAIRSPEAENFTDVAAVLRGHGGRFIRRLPLRPGDLQLFRGRYSLHRVSQVGGGTARHSAIFSYSERADVVGRAERTRQLFGRVDAAHVSPRERVDGLLD